MFEILPITGATWLVCGGRDFADRKMFEHGMQALAQQFGLPAVVVHGGAAGADTMAGNWAERMSIDWEIEKADWSTHGKAAGPMRNQAMIDKYAPDLVIAFPGGRGTADMVSRANAAGIKVAEISEQPD